MNALEFIQELDLGNHDAKSAFAIFDRDYPASCSYPYFRTKFNNHKKTNVGSIELTEDTTIQPELVEEMMVELAKRETKNYQEGDELPEIPSLIPTGTLFDEIISDRITTDEEKEEWFDRNGHPFPEDQIEIGGFTRKCIDIVAGDPGAGKTYSRNILAAKAKLFAKREFDKDLVVHFISGEMEESEWAKELGSCELLKHVEVTYMLDYVGEPNYDEIFWDAFSYGDIVICDSLPAFISHMKMSWPASRGKVPTDKDLVFDFIKKSRKLVKENDNNVQVINQANKDGNYKGGTELPHMMSSMSFVKVDGEQRYMIFTKNRNNGRVKRKVFFSRTKTGDIEFNVEAYEAAYKQINDKKQTLSELMTDLHNKQQLGELGESSATEMNAQEMGTGGATPEELAELDAVPSHLAEDTSFEDTQAELDRITAEGGADSINPSVYLPNERRESAENREERIIDSLPNVD